MKMTATRPIPPVHLAVERQPRAFNGAMTCGVAQGRFGLTALIWSERGLAALGYGPTALEDLTRQLGCRPERDDDEALAKLKAMEAGRAVWLDLAGTGFQRKVWRALLEIEPGQTSTYGAIAKKLMQPDAVRAVGSAVARNPVSWLVPCHRVVGANRKLTGYRWGLEIKRRMLDEESHQTSIVA